MNKICTSIEQSKKLIEFGIDINTADMFYADIIVNNNHKYNLHPLESYGFKRFSETKTKESKHLSFIPAWSLTALLELIHDKIVVNNENYFLNFTKKRVEYRGRVTWDGQKCISKEAENLLDAVFEMVCWLKENGKL